MVSLDFLLGWRGGVESASIMPQSPGLSEIDEIAKLSVFVLHVFFINLGCDSDDELRAVSRKYLSSSKERDIRFTGAETKASPPPGAKDSEDVRMRARGTRASSTA